MIESFPQPEEQLQWVPSSERGLHSGPLSLVPYGGSLVDLEVGRGQTAMLLVDNDIVGVFDYGLHRLEVTKAGTIANEIGALEDEVESLLALHAPRDHESSTRAVRIVTSETIVLFIAADVPIVGAWGEDMPTPFLDADQGHLALRIRGHFGLAIDAPVLFYRSFLRCCEDITDDELLRIVRALVHRSFALSLSEAVDRFEQLRDGSMPWQTWQAGDLEDDLSDVGLSVQDFQVITDELPNNPQPVHQPTLV